VVGNPLFQSEDLAVLYSYDFARLILDSKNDPSTGTVCKGNGCPGYLITLGPGFFEFEATGFGLEPERNYAVCHVHCSWVSQKYVYWASKIRLHHLMPLSLLPLDQE
jgi:hypothetical protein